MASRLVLLGILIAALAPTPARAQADPIARGQQLFDGTVPFARGGPACAACHDTAMLPRPGGGTMGPDLTTIAERIGPQGLATALETLYFPTMTPLFSAHPLTADERQAVAAFLAASPSARPRQTAGTIVLGIAAVGGGIVLLAITGVAGRSRIHSVRLALLARAAADGKRSAS